MTANYQPYSIVYWIFGYSWRCHGYREVTKSHVQKASSQRLRLIVQCLKHRFIY